LSGIISRKVDTNILPPPAEAAFNAYEAVNAYDELLELTE
jgi:hypothetical protein